MYTVILVIHTILVLFLIGIVLIQRTDSDGLSGLGGGGGGGNQFLTGRGSANLLTRTTAILAGIFMLTSMTLAIMASRMNDSSIVDAMEIQVPQPAAEEQQPVQVPVDDVDVNMPAKQEAPATEPVVPKPE